MGNKTVLNMDEKRSEELFTALVRTRNGLRYAIAEKNGPEIGFYFGWLDAYLTEVANACPECVKETIKAQIKGGDPQAGGGGEKPDPS